MEIKPALIETLKKTGEWLNFEVLTEVEASTSAWVDMVWFDRRFPIAALSSSKPKMRYAPVLPVVAFELELKTGLNAKHVKGSVSNLSNLGAQLGVIVIGEANVDTLHKVHSKKNRKKVEILLRDRIYRWVYAEAQPRTRVIVMFEHEVEAWSNKLLLTQPGDVALTVGISNIVGA